MRLLFLILSVALIFHVLQNNEWALFYLFSQPILLSSGNHLLIKWMTNFMKTTGNTLSQFNGDAFRMYVTVLYQYVLVTI